MSVDPLYDASSTTVQISAVACITDRKFEPSHLHGLIVRTGPAVFFQAAFVEGNKGQRVEINIVVDLQQTSREDGNMHKRKSSVDKKTDSKAACRLHQLAQLVCPSCPQSDIHHIHPTVRLELMQVP